MRFQDFCNAHGRIVSSNVCKVDEINDSLLTDLTRVEGSATVWMKKGDRGVVIEKAKDFYLVTVSNAVDVTQQFSTDDMCLKGFEARRRALIERGGELKGRCIGNKLVGKAFYVYQSKVPADLERERIVEMIGKRLGKTEYPPDYLMNLFPETFRRMSKKTFVVG